MGTNARGNKTKEKIYEEAFRLFISKPYELVTIQDIERVTGKTRGAIFHHVKDKHELFEKVIEKYFLKNQNLYESIGHDILEKDITLLEFIDLYTSIQEERISKLAVFAGIDRESANKKVSSKMESFYLGLLFNTGHYIDDYNEKMDDNFRMDKNTWSFFIQKAIEKGEVKPNTNVRLFGEIFTSIYLGKAISDSFGKGVSIKEIKELFMEIYNRIKA
jgi:ribosomal protein S24E